MEYSANIQWSIMLWLIAMCLNIASSVVITLGRREGITIGMIWRAGSSVYRKLDVLTKPKAARWARLLALLGCSIALISVACMLNPIWVGGVI
jgi:hypothetical protein